MQTPIECFWQQNRKKKKKQRKAKKWRRHSPTNKIFIIFFLCFRSLKRTIYFVYFSYFFPVSTQFIFLVKQYQNKRFVFSDYHKKKKTSISGEYCPFNLTVDAFTSIIFLFFVLWVYQIFPLGFFFFILFFVIYL